VDERFEAAVRVIQGLPRDGSYQPSNDMKLKFYAFYKQAREGPCIGPRPGFWDVVARAKHEAWAKLGDMDRNTAMENYIEALKQIIETINFNADVEKFIEVLGPFYEYVEEDRLVVDKSLFLSSSRTNKDTELMKIQRQEGLEISHGGEWDLEGMQGMKGDIGGKEEDILGMLGQFSSSMDEEEVIDCLGNLEDNGRLMEEIQWTKENLEQTMVMLKEVSDDWHYDGKEDMGRNCSRKEGIGVTTGKNGGLTQLEIDRLLDNVEGFLPREEKIHSTEMNSYGEFTSNVSVHSSEDDSDQDEIFEDSLEVPDDVRPVHLDVQVVQVATETDPSPLDSGIYESSPEPDYSTSSRLVSTVPSVPRVHVRQAEASLEEDEEDEILIVSSSRCLPSNDLHPMFDIVERMAGDMEHLNARVTSLETILSLRQEKRRLVRWWPFQELNPRTVLFMVTWPLLAHGLLYLTKLAVRRARK